MKYYGLLTVLSLSMMTTACAVTPPAVSKQGQLMEVSELYAEHKTFQANHQSYTVDQTDVDLIRSVDQPLTIVALFGSWCHDSEREVPRLVKLLSQAQNPLIELKLIAVNTKKEAPASYRLKYTPTFLVMNAQQQEVGRIVERPAATLGQDIVNMLIN